MGIVLAGVFLLSFMTAILSIGLPNPAQLIAQRELESTKVLDRNGVVLYDIFGEKRRDFVSLAEIPDFIKQATIAAEDKDFYSHQGFDIRGLVRGVIIKPLTGQRAQGGSTITQQLAINTFLTREISLSRKLQDILLALQIERNFTKIKIA